MNTIIVSMVSLSSMGLLFGAGLAYASKKFNVVMDPREKAILDALPGANCGGCGYPGCGGLATAISNGSAEVDACPVGGKEVANQIATIMGVEASSGQRKVAHVICNGTNSNAINVSEYQGIIDCKAANLVMGGPKGCSYGCMGYGTCERICPFDAIHVLSDGIAHVDEDKCVACGKCIEACPKHVIDYSPYGQKVSIECNSKDKGKEVKSSCSVGCIGCQICVNSCPFDAIGFENNLAKIDYEKCRECMICVSKCPTKAIRGQIKKAKENQHSDTSSPKEPLTV